MKKQIFILIAVLIAVPCVLKAQSNLKHAEDEKAIRQIVADISDAWKAGDGGKFARHFAEDADYTVWNGFFSSGQKAIADGHQQIFDTFYEGTEIRVKIRKIRFLEDNLAAVHLESTVFKDGEPKKDVPATVPLAVLKKEKGIWKVFVFQNTPVIREGELTVGKKEPLERKK